MFDYEKRKIDSDHRATGGRQNRKKGKPRKGVWTWNRILVKIYLEDFINIVRKRSISHRFWKCQAACSPEMLEMWIYLQGKHKNQKHWFTCANWLECSRSTYENRKIFITSGNHDAFPFCLQKVLKRRKISFSDEIWRVFKKKKKSPWSIRQIVQKKVNHCPKVFIFWQSLWLSNCKSQRTNGETRQKVSWNLGLKSSRKTTSTDACQVGVALPRTNDNYQRRRRLNQVLLQIRGKC